MKVVVTILVAVVAGLSILVGQACQLGKSESFDTLSAADLSALVETMPDQQRRMLAQNEAQRKGLVTQFKQMFSLAQAAQAEGLDKRDTFGGRFALLSDQLLIGEAQKRNVDMGYTEDQGKAYVAAHQKEFDADLKMITEGQKDGPTAEQAEMLKSQWGEMKVRAQKARQSGLEKDPVIALQLKFRRANLLADLYSADLEKKLKPKPEEMKQYLVEHPEADLGKIEQKAKDLLARVKKGEDFNTIASQFTEDGSREQGGDLGWFGKGKMDPDFEAVAFGLAKGQTSEVVKTRFGFHIIKLDDERIAKPTPTPKQTETPGMPQPTPEKPPQPTGPQKEIKARHIYLSTQEADGVEQMLVQKKIKRAMEDTTLKYPVKSIEDFTVNVGGLRKDGAIPNTGSGRIITPN